MLHISSKADGGHEIFFLAGPEGQVLLRQEILLERDGLSLNQRREQLVLGRVCVFLDLSNLVEVGHLVIGIASKQLAIDVVVLLADLDD